MARTLANYIASLADNASPGAGDDVPLLTDGTTLEKADAADLAGGGGSVATDAIWDAKGDLAVGTGANTAAKLTAGSNGQVLSANSATSTGLEWVAAGTGTVDTANSPQANDIARFTNANTIEGLTYAELRSAINVANGATDDTTVDAHIADATDAHDASAISFSPAEGIAATDVQAAIQDVVTDAAATYLAKATVPVTIEVACSDETTAITATGTKVTFRLPHAMTLTGVRASLTSACTTGTFTIDVNEADTSVLSTKLTIDATEKTSTTAATAAVISDSSLADDAEITIDVDNVGDSTATGLKVTLIGTRAVS